MTLSRWDSEANVVRNAMDRIFEDGFFPRMARLTEGPRPLALDVYESDNDLVVQAALPSVRPEDVEITLEQGNLTIRARRAEDTKVENARWLQRELFHGEYARSIMLPTGYEGDKAAASFEGGLLTLRVPKAEAARPKQIKIAAAAAK